MKKIQTVFKIDREQNMATNEVNPGAQWVLEGKGIATLKMDGSACMVKDGQIYRRFDRKLKPQFMKQLRLQGHLDNVTEDMFNELPKDAIPCQDQPDSKTYHHPHWIKIKPFLPEDKFHFEALKNFKGKLEDGTYEIIGHKINHNPYNLDTQIFVKHGSTILNVPDRSYEGLKTFLETLDGEGIVFHNLETDEMAKIRRRDFKMFWNHEDTRDTRVESKPRGMKKV